MPGLGRDRVDHPRRHGHRVLAERVRLLLPPSAARTQRSRLSSVMGRTVPSGRSRRRPDSPPRATALGRRVAASDERGRLRGAERASRASPARTSASAMPSRRRSGRTASRYRFPRHPSKAAISAPTIGRRPPRRAARRGPCSTSRSSASGVSGVSACPLAPAPTAPERHRSRRVRPIARSPTPT